MPPEALREPKQPAPRTEQIEEAMRLQAPQLELLYRLGVAQMIQKAAGAEIPPLVFEDDSTQPPTVDLKRTEKMAMPIFENGLWRERWMLNPIPHKTDNNGLFDTTLRIIALRMVNQKVKGYGNTRDAQSVLIEFTQDGQLKVVGEKTTYNGDLTTIDKEGLAQVQDGIKEAFSNPYIEPESATGWHLE